jgi:hypothetical protein
MKTTLKLSVILFAATWFLAGCATAPGRSVAREYRVVHGVSDAGGVAGLEEKLNAAGREGFTIHSTTVLPKEDGQRQQALIILERPAR